MTAPLAICLYVPVESLARSLRDLLDAARFNVEWFTTPQTFLDYVQQHSVTIDCLVIQNIAQNLGLLDQLYEQSILLPVVILEPKSSENSNQILTESYISTPSATNYRYHTGEVSLLAHQLGEMPTAIDRAIACFLKLAPTAELNEPNPDLAASLAVYRRHLLEQQQRLAEKLKERLGYLGVYYKRNPNDFYRNLSPHERVQLLKQIRVAYRDVILNYFSTNYPLNQNIDQLVNQAFFADLSVSQVLEIHMELIDDFAQQLKLEGRSEDILLDYRLALIDIIAHLCEMYRRSIPREDIPFEVFND
ncbi:MAG: circadian clock protein KaiA [Spirulina sp. SIO3F2]|nr:circadian clock protein KaiA [Spirulina sp. SIO3F2]